MINNMDYKQFIYLLNSGEIKGISFSVKNYPHYSNCLIYRKTDTTKVGKRASIIVCILTPDETEKVSFLNKFDDSYKLFDMKRKGRYTLQDIWEQIEGVIL